MTTDLKPCPFCGSPARVEEGVNDETGNAIYQIMCGDIYGELGCEVRPCTYWTDERWAAVKNWNTRAPVRVKLPSKRKPGDNEEDYGYNCAIDDVVHALKAQGVEAAP